MGVVPGHGEGSASFSTFLLRLSPSISLAFHRVLQEALRNVVKHSKANHVRVELTGGGDELKLFVRDNGVGFDYDQSRFGTGLGLISMRERTHLIGGRLRVYSHPKNGTLIDQDVIAREIIVNGEIFRLRDPSGQLLLKQQ